MTVGAGTARPRRWARAAAGAAVVAGLVGGLAACGGGGGSERSVEVRSDVSADVASVALARASESTGEVESGKVRVTYVVSGATGGEPFEATMTGQGSFADFGRKADLVVEMRDMSFSGDSGGQGPFAMRQVVDGERAWVKYDSADALPGIGDRWVELDAATLTGGIEGAGAAGGAGTDWTGFVDSLKGAGADVTEAGSDTIDGTPVTIYAGTIDPEAAIREASPDEAADVQAAMDSFGGTLEMPFTAWVDADGLIRRLELEVSIATEDTTMEMAITLELYDLGVPVDIAPPPADEVFDLGGLSGLLRGADGWSGLGGLEGAASASGSGPG